MNILTNTLQNKLLLLVMIPTTVIATALTFYMTTSRIGDMEQLTQEKAIAIAEQIAADNVNTLFTRNKDQLIQKVERYFDSYQDLVAVNIHSIDKRFSHNKSVPINKSSDILTTRADIKLNIIADSLEDYDFYEVDINDTPSIIGEVEITLLDHSTTQKMEIIQTSTVILVVTLFLTMLFIFPMSRHVTTPIRKLVNAFEVIEKGSFDTRVKEDSRDELGNLQRGFNQMARALSRQHEDLTEQVDQVTEDLQTTMQALEIQNVELDLARKQALESSRVKSEFLANMSHEIRTPMNGVIGFTGLLKKTKLSKTQHQYLQTIELSAKSLLQILNDILDFSKLEAGKIEINQQAFDIEDCIAEVIDIFAPLAHEKKLNLVHIIYNDVPARVEGDRLRIIQILSNLLSNAIKFTLQGDVVLRVMIDDMYETGCSIIFSVNDTGIGIPEDKQQLLFRPFRQVSNDISRGFGGTGLGLSICKSLIEMMDGNIQLESQEKVGSTFTVTIPFPIPPGCKSPDRPISDLPFYNKRLFLLESHPLSMSSLNNMFIKLGFTVDTGDNFDISKLEINALANYDVVVIALTTDELEYFSNKNSSLFNTSSVPVILLVSSSDQFLLDRYAEIFSCPVLKKPIFKKQILSTFQEILTTASVEDYPDEMDFSYIKQILHLKKVLVVDDNEINQQLLAAILQESGAIISTALNGQDAVELCQSMAFDLIFMDIHMPELNGIDATAELRASGHLGPIIALTADIAFMEAGTCEHYGFNDVIIKPIEAQQINLVLTRIFGNIIPEQDIASGEQPVIEKVDTQLPVRDFEQALRITGGKKSVADRLFSQLVEQVPGYMASIRNEFIEKDWKSLWQVLHKLHGATSVCGVPAFNKVINDMQKLVQKADYLTFGKELEKLEKEAKRIIQYESKLPRR